MEKNSNHFRALHVNDKLKPQNLLAIEKLNNSSMKLGIYQYQEARLKFDILESHILDRKEENMLNIGY